MDMCHIFKTLSFWFEWVTTERNTVQIKMHYKEFMFLQLKDINASERILLGSNNIFQVDRRALFLVSFYFSPLYLQFTLPQVFYI